MSDFIEIHCSEVIIDQTILVNLNRVREIQELDDGTALIICGELVLPLGRIIPWELRTDESYKEIKRMIMGG